MGTRMRVDFGLLDGDGTSLAVTAGQVTGSTGAFRSSGAGLSFARGAYAGLAQRILVGVERLAQRVEEGFRQVIRAHGMVASRIANQLRTDDERLAAEARAKTAESGQPPQPRPPRDPQPRPPTVADPEKPHPYNPYELIPAGVRGEPFGPTSRFENGRDYSWSDADGRRVRLHAHTWDPEAPVGSNSHSGPTYRVDIDARYVDANGRRYPKFAWKKGHADYESTFANLTHIPWPKDIRLPWESL